MDNIRMKTFKHNKIETCKITGKPIDTQKEKYAILLDCEGDVIGSIGFYKADILEDLINKKGELIQKQIMSNALQGAKSVLEGMGVIAPVFEVTGEPPKHEAKL